MERRTQNLGRKKREKRPLRKREHRYEDNIKIKFEIVACMGVDGFNWLSVGSAQALLSTP